MLKGVIRSKEALRALNHVLNKVKSFNLSRRPLMIEYINIGGSSLSPEKIRDTGIVLGYSCRVEYTSE
ncbi:MAG: hypothetical protein DRO40_06800 [Thermoprotei archaeon]|nr:MAG: hypothetical protein DRO40_06800 [Thermoprotei archaeon]